MDHPQLITEFLSGGPLAVVGASRDRRKYGNKVLRSLLQHQREVYAVNPNADTVEGLVCYPDLASVPAVLHGISVITPPSVTAAIVAQAAEQGIQYVWLQPGAESAEVLRTAERLGLKVIHSGPCLLVVLGFPE